MSDSDPIKLSALDLMPDWVTNLGKTLQPGFEEGPNFEGEERRGRDRRGGGGGGGKGRPREGQGGGRPFDRSRINRGGGDAGGSPQRDGGGGRREFGNRDRDRRGSGGGRGRFGEERREGGDRRFRVEDECPPSDVTVSVEPSAESVAALARHIRGTGRTYALVDLAKMILQGRERYQLRFRAESPAERPLYFCGADDSLWLSRDEALAHVLKGPALDRYYRIEDVPIDPPKGNFTVVAVCGLSGVVLGPPNHHDYTIRVVRLHKERFSDMPFERYKSRIEMHRDEESIAKWKAEASVQRQYRARPEPLAPGQEDPDAPALAAPPQEIAEAPAGEMAGIDESAETDASFSDADVESAGQTAESVDADPAADAAPESDSQLAEAGVESDGAQESAIAPADDTKANAGGEIIKSAEALERHFKQHFADAAAQAVTVAVVPGSVSGKKLARGLLTLLKIEVDRQRKSFPLGIIQHLCREFETAGLRFFKRGKKALHVCVARPRVIEDEEALSERVREIIRYVREHPRKRVVDLLDALVSDYQRPAEGESFEQHHLTEKEHAVLADLRWLTMEGYVLEFPGTELVLAKIDAPPSPPAAQKKGKNAKSVQEPAAATAPTEAEAGDSAEEEMITVSKPDAGLVVEDPTAEAGETGDLVGAETKDSGDATPKAEQEAEMAAETDLSETAE